MLSIDEELASGTGISAVILLLPVLLLLLSASGVWLARNRAMRTQWGVSAAMALAIWVVSLLLRLGPDLQYQISVWQPSEIFSSPLSLSMDTISWPIMYAVVTVLVAMIFTAAARERETKTEARVFWFLYSACALLAISADNLLTVVITWTLFDFLSAVFLIGFLGYEAEMRQVLSRLGLNLFGVLLVLAGSAVSIAEGDGISLVNPIHAPLSVFLLAMGAFVRVGLQPLHFNLPALLTERRGLGTLMRLYPPAIALTFLARLFRAGIPDTTLGWFLVAGVGGALIGGLRWMLETDAIVGRQYIILGISGVGILAAASMPQEYLGIVAAAVVILLAGAVLSLTVIHTPSHRVFALGAAFLILGIPWLPSSILTNTASLAALMLWPGLLWALIMVVAMSMAILGSLHLYFAEELPWRTSESLVRMTYGLGLSLPVFTSIGIGFQLRPSIGLWTWILLGIQIALVVLGYFALRKLPEGSAGRFQINISRFDSADVYERFGRAMGVFLQAVRGIAGLIEGEAAILWIFAITTFLILASG